MASNELLTEQFYFCNTMPRTNLAVRVASAVFRIASEMCRFPAYFDNPDDDNNNNNKVLLNPISIFMLFKNPGCLKARKCRGINTSTINLAHHCD